MVTWYHSPLILSPSAPRAVTDCSSACVAPRQAAADWIAGILRVLAKPQSPGPMADEAVADEAVADEATCLAEAARQRALALDQHEADHAALWAQATAVLNVKVLIPVTLDSAANNFRPSANGAVSSSWCWASTP